MHSNSLQHPLKLAARSFLAAFLTLAILPSLQGQEPSSREVTLQGALELMVLNNLELQLARARATELDGLTLQTKAYPNPRLAVTHEPLWRGDETSHETYVNFSQEVERPSFRKARFEAADHLANAADFNIQAEKLRLAQEVVVAYVEAVAAEEQRRVLEEVTAMFRQADRAGKVMLEEGEISAYRVRRLRVERSRYETRLASAAVDTLHARRRLALLTLPEGEEVVPIPTEGLSKRLPPLTLETALAEAGKRAELRSAEENIAAQQAALILAKEERRPTPTFTAGYKNQSDGFEGLFLGGVIRLPLFNKSRGTLLAQEARLSAAQTRLQLRRREIEHDVRSAYALYASAGEKVRLLSQDLLIDVDGLLQSARTSYAEGEMSLVELLDAAAAYRDARATTIDLQAALHRAHYEVLRASGQDFTTASQENR